MSDRVKYDEDIAPTFAHLLTEAALTHGAPAFAADLAKHGTDGLHMMAGRWRDGGFNPAEFANELELVADDIRSMEKERGI